MIDLHNPDPGIEISIATRGISKGLTQTDGAQVVVRPELAFGDIYLGAYAKNVTSTTSDGEGGPVIGLRTSAGGFNLVASATGKLSIDPTEGSDPEALELAGSAARRLGPLNLRLGITWSPDDLGSTGESTWIEGTTTYDLGADFAASAAIGFRERDGGPDYTAFNVGISRTFFGHLTADIRWYDTDRSAQGDAFEGRLVGTLRARF